MIFTHEFAILHLLEVQGMQDARRIVAGYHIRRTTSALGSTLVSMEKRGLIERGIKVRGRHLWSITEKGRAVVYGDEWVKR